MHDYATRNGFATAIAPSRRTEWLFLGVVVVVLVATLSALALTLFVLSGIMAELRGVQVELRGMQERNEQAAKSEADHAHKLDAIRKRQLSLETDLLVQMEDARRQMRELRDEMKATKGNE